MSQVCCNVTGVLSCHRCVVLSQVLLSCHRCVVLSQVLLSCHRCIKLTRSDLEAGEAASDLWSWLLHNESVNVTAKQSGYWLLLLLSSFSSSLSTVVVVLLLSLPLFHCHNIHLVVVIFVVICHFCPRQQSSPHTNHTCLYSPATRHHRPLAGTHCVYPQRDDQAELTWWLVHTKINVPHRELNPDTVTHLGTNRARH